MFHGPSQRVLVAQGGRSDGGHQTSPWLEAVWESRKFRAGREDLWRGATGVRGSLDEDVLRSHPGDHPQSGDGSPTRRPSALWARQRDKPDLKYCQGQIFKVLRAHGEIGYFF